MLDINPTLWGFVRNSSNTFNNLRLAGVGRRITSVSCSPSRYRDICGYKNARWRSNFNYVVGIY